MRFGFLLITAILVPLECLGMEFVHQDTVLMTEIGGATNGRLGWAVTVNDGSVFMGAPEKDAPKGATYEYRISSLRELEFVRELDPQAARPSRYGEMIVSGGDVTAVGHGSGATPVIELYVLQAGNWVLSKVLDPPQIDNVTVRKFGHIMDLEGDFLVVGDPDAIVGGVGNEGVVMIFGRNVGGSGNWGMVTHFLDPDPPEDRNFAASVAISSDLMVVGDDVADRALLYQRIGNDWLYQKPLPAVDFEADDRLGISVEAEGDVIAVGALNGNDAEDPTNAGSVHLFHRDEGGSNNFGQVAQITPSVPDYIDRFGEAIRLRQGLLVVGAPGAQQVYVFSRLGGE